MEDNLLEENLCSYELYTIGYTGDPFFVKLGQGLLFGVSNEDRRNTWGRLRGHEACTLIIPAIRLRSSRTSEGDTFSRVVAASRTPPSCHIHIQYLATTATS